MSVTEVDNELRTINSIFEDILNLDYIYFLVSENSFDVNFFRLLN